MVGTIFANVQGTVKASAKANDYPIVLVHGLTGWGSDEMLGVFRYWGGLGDIQKHLNNQGFTTYEGVVGPFSSNHDRAVELYYYIKGGTVDYGEVHSRKHGHKRFGKTYPGVYPEWDGTSKIHLVGHSMGGLTSRELANLIAEGCEEERAYYEQYPEVGISPLLAGQANEGIHSITTIATPNNGTSFAEDKNLFVPFMKDLATYMASASGVVPNRNLYDFKLDHFGLSREKGEFLTPYMHRVFNSSIWNSTDLAHIDLSVKGVTANRKKLKTRSDIYYFSYTGQTTERIPLVNIHRPLLTTNPLFMPSTAFMIKYTDRHSTPVIDSAWAPNDGLVNVVSSPYPFGDKAKPFDGRPNKGEWSYHPTMQGWDHLDLTGIGTKLPSQVNRLYLDLAKNLQALPQ